MLQLLTSSQSREADAHTIKTRPISSIDLMESASNAFVRAFIAELPNIDTTISVYCGTGNNGGEQVRGFVEASTILTNIANELPQKTVLLDKIIKQIIVNKGVIALDASASSLVERMLISAASWKIPIHQF